MGAKYTPAQKRAAEKYKREKRERIAIDAPPGYKKRFTDYAAARGESVTGFLIRAALNQIERDAPKSDGDAPPE